jgi:hypothetical protein
VYVLVGALGLFGCSSGGGDAIEFEASLAGQPVADSSPRNPIRLHQAQVTTLAVEAVNRTDQPLTIAHVRLEGQLLDLIFLTYDTGIHETLQPGEQRQIVFPLDFFDLDGQAHGLLRSQITLFDADRNSLGQQQLIIDGRGSPFATMSMFTMLLLGLTAVSLAWNLLRLAQRRLPVNRFARGLRFAHTGIGLGLALAALCSTIRIWPLPTTTWVPLTVITALIAFGAGYLSPGSESTTDGVLIDLARGQVPRPTMGAVPMVSTPRTSVARGPAAPHPTGGAEWSPPLFPARGPRASVGAEAVDPTIDTNELPPRPAYQAPPPPVYRGLRR